MNDRLFCYYGDDCTGSTDALEALAANGVPTVLFLDPPDERRLAAFPQCRAIGVAGESRSRPPAWMTAHLPSVFRALQNYGAPLCQYKVCSTFDSSPQTGSIGRALEIGRDVFQTSYVPVLVTAPHLGRYVLFGNLFAAAAGEVYRIDRHPSMRCHPVTPMDESDLRLHLARQTSRRIALLDVLKLRGGRAADELARLADSGAEVILFDGLDDSDLRQAGALLWTRRPAPRSFAVGSSGLTHALIRYWRAAGIISGDFTPEPARPADRLVVVSGSCSPATETQIRWAMANGFTAIRIDPAATSDDRLVAAGLSALERGAGVVLYTALGPGDCGPTAGGEELGCRLGRLLCDLLLRSGVRRAVVAGGDTSSHAVRQLGIHALSFAAVTAPGAPLCRAHSDHSALDGLELVLKGGQVGPPDYFATLLREKPK